MANNIPKLRYKGFEESIELEHLGNIIEVNNKVANTNEYSKITLGLNLSGIRYTGDTRLMADKRPFYLRRTGEILIGKQNFFNGSIAIIPKKFDQTICSNALISFKVLNNSTYYLYYYLSRKNYLKKNESLANGTGQKELSDSDLKKLKILLPSILEQEKIAKLLQKIDSLIWGKQKEIKLLEKASKALLKSLLASSNIPKNRFANFNDNWNFYKISDICTIKKGKGISKDDISMDGEIAAIRYGELYTYYNQDIDKVTSKINKKLLENSLVISKGNEVLSPASGEDAMEMATISALHVDNVAIGGDINIISSTQCNNTFLALYFNSIGKKEFAKLAQGSSIMHIYASHLNTINVNIPTLQEQQKIADLLKKYNELIGSNKQILNKYQLIKSKLLNEILL